MTDSAITVAKYGPVVVIVLSIAAVLGMVGLVEVDVVSQSAALVLLPFAMGGLAVTLLYQGVFILTRPETAIEHDINPPSKYDTSFETERGAKKIGVLTLVAGLFATVVLVVFGYSFLLG